MGLFSLGVPKHKCCPRKCTRCPAYDAGIREGQAQGFGAGFAQGHAQGYAQGQADGFSAGQASPQGT